MEVIITMEEKHEKIKVLVKKAKTEVLSTSQSAGKKIISVTKAVAKKAKENITNPLDQNGDGVVNIEDIITAGLKVPGIRIKRDDFLRKEFSRSLPQNIIDEAIAYTPLHAGISPVLIGDIAEEVIKYERACVSGISAVLGLTPGVATMVATVPADIIQYYGYMLRAAQKLMYLYGFPEIDTEYKGDSFDSETLNCLILCLGAMYGTAGAGEAIKAVANSLAQSVQRKLLNTALTKGTIYPVIKNVAKWFGINMTKEVFAGFFKKAIPVVGGVLSGGITYLSFKSCCEKLKGSLENTMLSNPQYKENEIFTPT